MVKMRYLLMAALALQPWGCSSDSGSKSGADDVGPDLHLVDTGPGDGDGDRGADGPAPLLCGLSLQSGGPSADASVGAAGGDHNCRMWGITSAGTPARVIEEHLVTLPSSIEALSTVNTNGWSVAFYPDGAKDPVVKRGKPAAHLDPQFDAAVDQAGKETPAIALSHVRKCSSGLCGIPDPHPFTRKKNGRTWVLAHNGTIQKSGLIKLIRPDYLAKNRPENGATQSEWIDSELYFLLLLQEIEDAGFQVEAGITSAIDKIKKGGVLYVGINFLLSDGVSLWAYREGMSLHYFHSDSPGHCSAVASQPPTAAPGHWKPVADRVLLTLSPGGPPVLTSL